MSAFAPLVEAKRTSIASALIALVDQRRQFTPAGLRRLVGRQPGGSAGSWTTGQSQGLWTTNFASRLCNSHQRSPEHLRISANKSSASGGIVARNGRLGKLASSSWFPTYPNPMTPDSADRLNVEPQAVQGAHDEAPQAILSLMAGCDRGRTCCRSPRHRAISAASAVARSQAGKLRQHLQTADILDPVRGEDPTPEVAPQLRPGRRAVAVRWPPVGGRWELRLAGVFLPRKCTL